MKRELDPARLAVVCGSLPRALVLRVFEFGVPAALGERLATTAFLSLPR
ncbi:MAG: hypothetical protein AAFV47_15295 [Pseudomonadota bacterium]